MAAPISNWVVLKPNVVVALHFYDHRILKRVITDPIRNVPVERESLVFYVDELDGVKTELMFSVMSQKLAAEFSGYLEGKKYVGYVFGILKEAAGFVPPKIAWVRPR